MAMRTRIPYLDGRWRCRVVGNTIRINGVHFVDSPDDLIVQEESQVVRLPIDLNGTVSAGAQSRGNHTCLTEKEW